jgi:hypothetical protein
VATGAATTGVLPAAGAAPREVLFVIPAGTAVAQMRGEGGVVIPPVIDIAAGGAVVVRNEDQAMHYFFAQPIAPGQTLRKEFPTAGTFGYTSILSCSVGGLESVTVNVKPAGR